jgi:hypothetical protein
MTALITDLFAATGISSVRREPHAKQPCPTCGREIPVITLPDSGAPGPFTGACEDTDYGFTSGYLSLSASTVSVYS